MRATRNRAQRTIQIDQTQYINDMLRRFKMEEPDREPAMPIPADPNVTLCKAMSRKTPMEIAQVKDKPYMNLVGSLLYAAILTRPDIANAVRLVSRYISNPGTQHWKAARRILR